MSYETNDRCACANCPGVSCDCGCQAAISTTAASYPALDCNCGPTCGCDGGEQGCLCQR